MKKFLKKTVCVITAACMLMQPSQAVYAEDTAAGNTEETAGLSKETGAQETGNVNKQAEETAVPPQETDADKTENENQPADKPENEKQPADETADENPPVDETADTNQPADETGNANQPAEETENENQPADETANENQQTDETADHAQHKPEKPRKRKKLPRPQVVKGLKTTKQGKNKVCLEWKKSRNASQYRIYKKVKGQSYQLVKTTKKTTYTDTKASFGKTYGYQILAVNEQKHAEKFAGITFSNTKTVHVFSEKYSYAQMKSDMLALKKKYSNYCEMTKIGESVCGRGIYDFAIGSPNAEKSLLVVSTLHAREYICSSVMMKELEYYLENYNRSVKGVVLAKTLKNMQIHYIVMANPDGVTISQTKKSQWKANARGVDLNRNFPAAKFVAGGMPGAQGYSGKKPLSEPETAAIAALTIRLKKGQKLRGVVNYHAMGQIIFGQCSKNSIKKDTAAMYRIAMQNTGYGAAYDGKTTYGGQYREYVMYMLDIPSITIEIGSSPAPCPYWQYEPEFNRNKNVVLQIAHNLN